MQKSIFTKKIDEDQHEQDESMFYNRQDRVNKFKLHLKHIFTNNSHISKTRESDKRILEGFSQQIPVPIQQCFSFFSQSIANARNLKTLNLSGMDLSPLLTIEIGQGIQNNSSLRELNLSGCRMNSFCLQYIFSCISNHKTLQSINLFNNQGFTIDLMNDFNQFIFNGKNQIKSIKLTHCNISSTALSFLLRNLKFAKNIQYLDISMMFFTPEVLTSLGIALQEFTGQKYLDHLNLGYNCIKDSGMEILAQRVNWNIRRINLKELVLKRNFLNQKSVEHLETFLRKIGSLQRLDLSYNHIKTFYCSDLLTRNLYEINLSNNFIQNIPQNFFFNTLMLNLSNNKINLKGAFQLSSILRTNPLWFDLDLSNNVIKSEGFNSLIFGLRDNTMLKKLNVANNQIDGEGLICYMINHEQVQFEVLDISFNSIRHQIIFVLLNYIKSGALRSLRCSYLQKDDDVPINNQLQVSKIKDKSNTVFQLTSFNLRELNFSGNKYIFTPVIVSLSTYFNKIEYLDLSSCNPVTDDDIDCLVQFLKKSTNIHNLNLRDLNLGQLKKETIKKISDACFNSSLKYLNLSKNKLYKQISKLFSFSLVKSSSNYRLETLDLSENLFESKHSWYIEQIISSFKNLQELNLAHNYINFHLLNAINRAIKVNGSLRKLKQQFIIISIANGRLSSDDLLMVSQIMSNEFIQDIQMANNLNVGLIKSFYYSCTTKKIRMLQLNKICMNTSNFQCLQKIIQINRRNLSGVSLDSIIFQQGDMHHFMTELAKINTLEYFALNYNPSIDKEMDTVMNSLYLLKSLKVLKLNQVSINFNVMVFLSDWLKRLDCKISILDISNNKLTQETFDIFSEALLMNKSLQEIYINNCQLGNLSFEQFAQSLQCKVLNVLSLNNNEIKNKFEDVLKILQLGIGEFYAEEVHIDQNPLSQEDIVSLLCKQYTKVKIKSIYLGKCGLNKGTFGQQQQFDLQEQLICCLQKISLEDNMLQDDVAQTIKFIVEKNPNMKELIISKNYLTSTGLLEIFDGVMKHKSLTTIDVSSNSIDCQFFEEILLNSKYDISSIDFFLIRGNKIKEQGQRAIFKLLEKCPKLFVDYCWFGLQDHEAKQVLNQYTRIGKRYRMIQNQLPLFLKEIQIQHSHLSDKFCEILAQEYPYLNFIELIDLSDNQYISMYGKVYLFIHLFDQRFEMHNLKYFYITDTIETRKLFDDGILRYYLLRFRNFVYPPTEQIKIYEQTFKIYNTDNQAVYNEQNALQKLIGNFCGVYIIHLINYMLVYLDRVQPPMFIVSTFFLGKFRRNARQIKIMVVAMLVINIIVDQLSFLKVMLYKDINFEELAESCRLRQDSCYRFQDNNQYEDMIYTIISFSFIFVLDIIQLITAVIWRGKLQPAFQIVHPTYMKYLRQRTPHRNEIWLTFRSIISRMTQFPQKIILYYAFQTRYIKGISDDQFFNYYCLFQAYVILEQLDFLFCWFIHVIKFLISNPKHDQAKFLSLLQRTLGQMYYFVLNDLLISICPTDGVQITKAIKLNYQIIFLFYRLLFIDLALLVLFVGYLIRYEEYIDVKAGGIDPFGALFFWLTIAIIKTFILLIFNIFQILTVRPPIVKQDAFNQAFTIKTYYDNKTQFIQPKYIQITYNFEDLYNQEKNQERMQKESDPKSGSKRKMDKILEDNQEYAQEDDRYESNNQSIKFVDEFQSILISDNENEIDIEDTANKPLNTNAKVHKYLI